jgi:hypothetical protein
LCPPSPTGPQPQTGPVWSSCSSLKKTFVPGAGVSYL